MPDMSMIMQQVQQMQEQLIGRRPRSRGQAGGNGLVEVTMTAPLQTSGLEIRSVRIDPKVVDPDDVDTLQDLIVGALQDAGARPPQLQAEKMGPLAGGLGGGLGGSACPASSAPCSKARSRI